MLPNNQYTDDGEGVYWEGTPEEEQEFLATYGQDLLNMRMDALWQAATAYQESYISGAAIGLLTIGVIQGKPKATAIMNWVQQIWGLYYIEKTNIDYHSPPCDFSIVGAIPFTVPELQNEVLNNG